MTPLRLGAWLWLVRPLYFLSEVVVAAGVGAPYSWRDDTVSALGVVGCPVAADLAPGCSPRHELMNGSFVGYGVLMAAGALLQGEPHSRRSLGATVLLVVAGLGSVAVGLAPLDRGSGVHAAAALPVFAAQPVALLLLGSLVWAERRAAALVLIGAGVLSVAGAVGFGLTLSAASGNGLVERAALWPTFVALAVLGASRLRRPVAPAHSLS